MNLDNIPEPNERDWRLTNDLLQTYPPVNIQSSTTLPYLRVIAHLIRQGKVLARIVTDIGPRLTSEEESAIKTFEEIE